MLAAALATVLVADEGLDRFALPWLVGGMLDEPAHIATAALIEANLPAGGPAWTAALFAGSISPDVDHLPLIPVRHELKKDDPRPALHTLLTPAAVAALGSLCRARTREAVLGLAAGICVHFARDVGTGSGLPVLQPLTRSRLKLPRRSYEVVMLLLAWRAWKLGER